MEVTTMYHVSRIVRARAIRSQAQIGDATLGTTQIGHFGQLVG